MLKQELKKLSDRIYYMPCDSKTDRPVIGLICGDKYSLVVDSGNSPAHAHKFLECAGKLDIPPLKYLAITHWHWDHIFGIEYMKLTTLCHEKTQEKLSELQQVSWDDTSLEKRVEKGEEITFCSEMMKLEMPDRSDLKIGNADITFKDKFESDLGGISCIIENVGGCHSEDSSVIYVPDEKVMFLGDCLSEDFYSGDWSYDKDALTAMINKIQKYDADIYVMSHCNPQSREEVWAFLDKLMNIGELAQDDTESHKVVDRFIIKNKRLPEMDEVYYINTFVNGNRKKRL